MWQCFLRCPTSPIANIVLEGKSWLMPSLSGANLGWAVGKGSMIGAVPATEAAGEDPYT